MSRKLISQTNLHTSIYRHWFMENTQEKHCGCSLESIVCYLMDVIILILYLRVVISIYPIYFNLTKCY